jgi:hypothetical protein
MVDQERQKVSRPKDENAAVLLPSSKKRLLTGRLLERIDLSQAKGHLLAMQRPPFSTLPCPDSTGGS